MDWSPARQRLKDCVTHTHEQLRPSVGCSRFVLLEPSETPFDHCSIIFTGHLCESYLSRDDRAVLLLSGERPQMPQSMVARALWALLTAICTLQIGQAQLQCPTGKCSITVDLFETDSCLRNTAVLRAVFIDIAKRTTNASQACQVGQSICSAWLAAAHHRRSQTRIQSS